jgi:hypothetical protein
LWENMKERDSLEDLEVAWKDNIKVDLREIGCEGVKWINLTQNRGRVAGSCEHGYEALGSIKCWEFDGWLRSFRHFKKDSHPHFDDISWLFSYIVS